MKGPRIGFLLPHYNQPSNSHMPVVMRTLAEWGATADVIHPSDRSIDVSTVRVEHDLYVLKNTGGLAKSLAGALHAQGAFIVNPYPVTAALQDRVIVGRILQAAGVPTPATYVASRPDWLAPLLEAGALVVKPYRGTGGSGGYVVRSVAELAAGPAGEGT